MPVWVPLCQPWTPPASAQRLAFALALAVAHSCGAGTPVETADDWQGSIATDGLETAVINSAGALWSEPRRLSEATSIGVHEGLDIYMLGQPRSVAADQGRIFVADAQVPVVRVYDNEGRYLSDLGRAGQGPGEYVRPNSVAILPDGRVLVRDDGRYMIHVYDANGNHAGDWPSRHRVNTFDQMWVDASGTVFTPNSSLSNNRNRYGAQRVTPNGPAGDLLLPPAPMGDLVRITPQGAERGGVMLPPEYPQQYWVVNAAGYLVSGVGETTAYRFRQEDAAGKVVVVQRAKWDRVAYKEAERDAIRTRITAWARHIQPGWTWDIPPLPEYKPAFRGLAPAADGSMWVLRAGPGYRVPGCVSGTVREPCWRERLFYDVFDATGRFLGAVQAPEGLVPYLAPYIANDTYIAIVEDDSGISYVKRYQLKPGHDEVTSAARPQTDSR